jgi:pentatricopeptide repeat protein
VYQKLLDCRLQPIATTYTALISAYGKAGQLDKALDTFQAMIYHGCERSVITYSSLISACEKAGKWELALQLFEQMQREGCAPNTVTYNSLITACQQGGCNVLCGVCPGGGGCSVLCGVCPGVAGGWLDTCAAGCRPFAGARA